LILQFMEGGIGMQDRIDIALLDICKGAAARHFMTPF
jgi:hypothetical protein